MEDKQKKTKQKMSFEYTLQYQERESKRLQLFIYSLMAADFYAIIHTVGGLVTLLFLLSLMCALFAFYCWYRQDLEMCMRIIYKGIDSKVTENEQNLHNWTFFAIVLSALLILIGVAVERQIWCNPFFYIPMLVVVIIIVRMHRPLLERGK